MIKGNLSIEPLDTFWDLLVRLTLPSGWKLISTYKTKQEAINAAQYYLEQGLDCVVEEGCKEEF